MNRDDIMRELQTLPLADQLRIFNDLYHQLGFAPSPAKVANPTWSVETLTKRLVGPFPGKSVSEIVNEGRGDW
jgi:hypothetical protein